MPQVTVRLADGSLVRGELVMELPRLTDWQISHIHEVAYRWNNHAEDRALFKSLAHRLLWSDGLGMDIEAITWHRSTSASSRNPASTPAQGRGKPSTTPKARSRAASTGGSCRLRLSQKCPFAPQAFPF
jgi:hypothetical protein